MAHFIGATEHGVKISMSNRKPPITETKDMVHDNTVEGEEFAHPLVVPWVVVVPTRLRRGSAACAAACRSLAPKDSCREKSGGRGRACGGGCDDDDDDLMREDETASRSVAHENNTVDTCCAELRLSIFFGKVGRHHLHLQAGR